MRTFLQYKKIKIPKIIKVFMKMKEQSQPKCLIATYSNKN